MHLILTALIFLSSYAHAESFGAYLRRDVNRVFFGGREGNQRFVNYRGTCEVMIRNYPGDRVTGVSVSGRLTKNFFISETDSNLTPWEDYSFKTGMIAAMTGNSHDQGLRIRQRFSGKTRIFTVSIADGVGVPISCEVY